MQHIVLAGGDCDLVGPLSTVLGLGSRGPDLGVERLFRLPNETHAFVTNPLNYHRVQVTRSSVCSTLYSCLAAQLCTSPGRH